MPPYAFLLKLHAFNASCAAHIAQNAPGPRLLATFMNNAG